MRSIGFKNFRKFKEFPPIALSPITILVGENNAGKSTLVKGILAVSDFLKARERFIEVFASIDERRDNNENSRKRRIKAFLNDQKFYFNVSYLAHIGTFKRALYNKADEGLISFRVCLKNNMDVEIDITGDKNDDEAVSGKVTKIIVKYINYNITIIFNLPEDVATLIFSPIDDTGAALLGINNRREKERLQAYYDACKESVSISMTLSDYMRRLSPDLIGTYVCI